ncbi:antistasin-like [Liolophura sinensis]|uniref:antistasin-like n=1 Tax=Liolophura sinensis TaxID=3198878 RepID=UPI0031590CCA
MSCLSHILLAVTVLVLTVNAVRDGCPDYNLLGPWGCAYMPKCFGDSMCPAGQQCCPHPCGNQCAAIVHCKSLNCGKVCPHGYERGADGCQTCHCRDKSKCTTFQCLLQNTNLLEGK